MPNTSVKSRPSHARRGSPRHHTIARISGIALALAVLHAPAGAVDSLWKGNWGNWDDANEWTLLGVPGAGDSAELAGGASWIAAARSVGSLALTGGRLWGDGVLTAGSLDFQRGVLGGGGLASTYPTGFTTVTGTASFDGTRTQAIATSHTLTLQGTSAWTAGAGALGGSGAIVNTPGAVFTDQGAGAANAYKALRDVGGSYSGGTFINNGSYVRTGLGLTRVYGFENNGMLSLQGGTLEFRNAGSSAGHITVAAGTELAFYASTATVSGQIANQGLVSFDRSDVMLTSTAVLNGNVRVLDGVVRNHSSNTLANLEMAGGQITGTGHLTAQHLDFKAGTLGGSSSTYPVGFTTVTGAASFDGTRTQAIATNHTLTLQGTSAWTAGAGALGGSGAIVNATGAVFTDQGAGAANAYKALRDVGGSYNGGTFINNGSYVRTGLGLTRAYGFSNAGLLQLSAGRFAVEQHFSNVGEVRIDAGAVLESFGSAFDNNGLISGTGTIRTSSLSQPLVNAGTLTPGGLGTAGGLLLDGDLTQTATGQLRIDLDVGQQDLLTVTSDVSFAGTLQVWAAPGLALHLGDSFVVATYGQRLAASTFANVQWLGSGANPFSVEYGANALTLRVTSAVPEPATAALWLMGVAALLSWRSRRQPCAAQQ